MDKRLWLLILSDMLILSGFGLIGPIFAIFITGGSIEGGTLVAAGLATTVFLVAKSIVQLPLSRFFIDKEKHKTHSLLLGTLFIITVPFIYTAAENIYAIFVAQAIYGIGAAMAYPAWFDLFTAYMDKKHRGFEYTLWATGTGLGVALSAYLGAELAENLGFDYLFFIAGAIAFLGFLLLIVLDRIDGRKAKAPLAYSLRNRVKR